MTDSFPSSESRCQGPHLLKLLENKAKRERERLREEEGQREWLREREREEKIMTRIGN